MKTPEQITTQLLMSMGNVSTDDWDRAREAIVRAVQDAVTAAAKGADDRELAAIHARLAKIPPGPWQSGGPVEAASIVETIAGRPINGLSKQVYEVSHALDRCPPGLAVVNDYLTVSPAPEGRWEGKDIADFIANARDDIERLLAAVGFRNGVIADLQKDGGVEAGRREERREIADLLLAIDSEEELREVVCTEEGVRANSASVRAFIGLLLRKLEARGPRAEPLPPDALQDRCNRYRKALQEIDTAIFHNYHSDSDDAATLDTIEGLVSRALE